MASFLPLPPETHALRMDAAAWTGPLLDVEPGRFAAQMALKEAILDSNLPYYFHCPPDAESLAWEALELLLVGAARDWPQFFALHRAGPLWTWTNHLCGGTTRFRLGDGDTLPHPLLDWLGRQFQEDLILMAADERGEAVCAAGTLCFGSGWCLGDKIGKPFLDVHAEVPGFAAQAGRASDLLLRRLKPGRPVARWNWTLPATDRLNLAPALASEWAGERRGVTPQNAGERCFLRAERQTLSRLPRTGAILFTIHTYLTPISQVAADPEGRRALVAHVRSLSAAMIAYRGMTEYADALIAYLEQKREAP